MDRKIVFYIFFIAFHTAVLAEPTKEITNQVVHLKLPFSSNHAKYSKELLVKAYELIGYQIKWVDIESPQELELVNQNKLAAAIARSPIIEEEFPKLVQVPFKLFEFSLLKVSDRRRCGYCLNEDIQSIIYPQGARLSVSYAKSLNTSIDKLAIQKPDKLNEMIFRRRSDSVLIMDFLLAPEIIKNPHMIIKTVAREFDYHYLSPKYAYLKQPLTNAFEELKQNGTVANLQQKYQIQSFKALERIPEKVSFISGDWVGYSNSDGSGVYWNIIDALFESNFDVAKQASIWARAIRAFEQNQADILVGAYKGELSSPVVYSSFHLDYESQLFSFVRNEDVLQRFKAKDTTLTACLDSGSSLFKHINFIPKANVIETSLTQCDALIKNNKVDMVIDYQYNLEQYTLTLPKVLLVEKFPLFLVFHDNPKGHFLKSYFDKNIAELARKGDLKEFFPDEITFRKAHIRP